ncbi:uncharacterized protein K444DRAFT_621820 [Hyaloscypha bicolor E]|uniref:Uncharacterized protein n=1 Tax=Hyaloscypha bicolor E TaxID=1095630 RepID=A0A2J6SI43_9HELO|nr:uncharacterized protein K444DRAFT_621820 [Hyaloscypha bicolor E]PMD50437.1 hypothetical protein K444DRAFT_621820 [Hyaloscypha bicolor E]
MGFTKSSSSAPSTEDCSEETIQRAKECLSAINTAFSQAFDDGSVFLETAGREQTNILDSQIQIGESSDGWNTLHKALQQIYQTRTPRNNTVPKPNVIRLYEQDTFVGLVQIVSAQIRRLNKVFPSLKAEQTTLSSDEVIAIKGSGPIVILWLKGIVKSNDEFLHEALEKETSNKRNFFDGTDLKGKSKMHVGHKIAPGAMGSEGPTTWTNTTGSEEAEGHVGNSYGY